MNPAPHSPPESAGGPLARSPLDWPTEAGLARELAVEIRTEVRRRRRMRLGFATAACAVLAGLAYWRGGGVLAPAAAVSLAATKVSAPERRTLPDGSVVELRSGASIEANYTPALRRVVLTSGEAHFEVAKNPAQPFVVAADGIEVRAVGTAFSVERRGASVDVVVTEGRVSVARESAPAPVVPPAEPTMLAAGDHAMIATDARSAPDVTALDAAELGRRLAWRVPRLEFSGAALAEVVRLFAEHGRVRVVIRDATLREVKVSGILRADNTDALLQLLAADHAIAAEHRDGEIVLRRR